jgi:hypothetical protein
MFGWIVRFALFRLLPRKIIPIITLIEIARLGWGLRRRRSAVNEPWRSRTAQPPRADGTTTEPPRRR